MSPRSYADTIPAAPFREWLDEQLATGCPVELLAERLGVSDRRLRGTYLAEPCPEEFERRRVEDLLDHAEVPLWDVYPDHDDDPGELFDRYCPSCKETVTCVAEKVLPAPFREDGERTLYVCPWCEVQTLAKRPPRAGRRKGWRSAIPEDRVEELYVRHQAGESLRALGRELYEDCGYSTPQSCAMGLSAAFKRKYLRARERVEATALANVERAVPDSPGTADRRTYKRWRRKRNGGYRRCQGVKVQPPGKGRPCQRYALRDSDFCRNHDARYAEDRAAELAATRARIGQASGQSTRPPQGYTSPIPMQGNSEEGSKMHEPTREQHERVDQLASFHPRLTVEPPVWEGGTIRVRCLAPKGPARVVREVVIDATGRTVEPDPVAA